MNAYNSGESTAMEALEADVESAFKPYRREQRWQAAKRLARPAVACVALGLAAAVAINPTTRHATIGAVRYYAEGQRIGDPLFCAGSLPPIEQMEILGGSGRTTPGERAQMDCGILPLPFGANIDNGPSNVPGLPNVHGNYQPMQGGLTPAQEQAVS